jgi:4-amino-4-deoxy-L-arabinose transferase-like glycosyltransferase
MTRDLPWGARLALILLLALAVRVGYVLVLTHGTVGIDGLYYHLAANQLVDGEGFISPIFRRDFGLVVPAADKPPGYVLTLATASSLGFRTLVEHKLFSSLIGTATVAVLGLLGRRVAGERSGLLAAGIGAVYPMLWLNDGLVMSETVILLLAATTALVAYRAWERPSIRSVALVGLLCGGSILTRTEAALLIPLLAVPLAWSLRVRPARAAGAAGVLSLTAAATVAPWVVYNVSRFDRPVLITHSIGQTLVGANCPVSYSGPRMGYWAFECVTTGEPVEGDLSEVDAAFGRVGMRYSREHVDELPLVALARLGRTWGAFRPVDQLRLDETENGREFGLSVLGLAAFYGLVALAVPGGILLRRRRVPLTPLVALLFMVAIATALTYGQTRFRAPAEIALVVLAAVALDRLLSRGSHASRDAQEEPTARNQDQSVTAPASPHVAASDP